MLEAAKIVGINLFGVEWKKLDIIGKVTKLAGYEFTKYVKYSDYGSIIALRGVNVKKGSIILDDVKYIDNSNLGKLSRSKLYKNDLLYTYIGTVGEVALVNDNDRFYLAPNVALIRMTDDTVLSKYVMYYLQSNTFKHMQLEKYLANSSMKNLTMEKIRKFEIPIPPRAVQHHIVSILDKFDALVHDISQGLPKEIELRQKQYEYYREKLLNFAKD